MQWLQRDVAENTPGAKNHPSKASSLPNEQPQTRKWHENGLNKGRPLLLQSKRLLEREALMPFDKETPGLWLIRDRKRSRTLCPLEIPNPVEFYCWGWWKLWPINSLCIHCTAQSCPSAAPCTRLSRALKTDQRKHHSKFSGCIRFDFSSPFLTSQSSLTIPTLSPCQSLVSSRKEHSASLTHFLQVTKSPLWGSPIQGSSDTNFAGRSPLCWTALSPWSGAAPQIPLRQLYFPKLPFPLCFPRATKHIYWLTQDDSITGTCSNNEMDN